MFLLVWPWRDLLQLLERVRDIQLVITDINMPGSMDGLRLAAAIRERWPPIHLIVVTGFTPPNKSELPTDSLFVPMTQPKSFQRYGTSSRPGSCYDSGGLCPLAAPVISEAASGATAISGEP
jgi:CheY-like chemotaxis protein